MTIAVGSTIPEFDLPASGGRVVSSEALKGKGYVLYFYPKADTSGCTKEACAFQEALPSFKNLAVEVLGVSRDAVKVLEKFAAKFDLTFPLISDEDGKFVEACGVWVEKSMYGRKYMGIERSTVLVDENGRVVQVWPKVKIEGHAAEVLQAALSLIKAA